MAESMEEVNVGENKQEMACLLSCTALLYAKFCKSLKFFGTPIASSFPETVDLPAFYILSAMFTGVCQVARQRS